MVCIPISPLGKWLEQSNDVRNEFKLAGRRRARRSSQGLRRRILIGLRNAAAGLLGATDRPSIRLERQRRLPDDERQRQQDGPNSVHKFSANGALPARITSPPQPAHRRSS